MSNFCNTCVWWSYTYPDGNKRFGTCENPLVTELIRLSQDYDSIENDDPTIYTESNFGCIHHENKKHENAVAEIKIPKK